MKDTLRLLLTGFCPKKCEGCCNKQWDLKNLPVAHDFSKFNTVLITGGEPLHYAYRNVTLVLIEYLQQFYPHIRIIVYTSNVEGILWLHENVLIDGYTFTLHPGDSMVEFNDLIYSFNMQKEYTKKNLSLRLTVFKGVEIPSHLDLSLWKVKKDMEWIPDCSLPENEVFMKVPDLE